LKIKPNSSSCNKPKNLEIKKKNRNSQIAIKKENFQIKKKL